MGTKDGVDMATAEVLLHPVRLRVVQALLGDRRLTTGELRAELADVPPATLYRQVAVLAEAGVLVVVGEERVRGAVERTYALALPAAQIGPEELAAMTVADHQRAFAAFVAGLLADFDRYLDRGDVDLARDGVGYRQVALELSDAELADLVGELGGVLAARTGHAAAPGRVRRLFSTVLLPAGPAGEVTG
jgi:DNA-binding transcriptional ArsR family regulator